MNEEFKRKLAAILSADVVGYSRLMDDNEEATIRTLKDYRSLIADNVKQYRGRVVDSPGDNILSEFISVVDALKCAVEIQKALYEKNAKLTDDRKMEFRIGINLGDVVEEDGRIYGDGVNIAARVESFADAGGICISGRVYDHVENKIALEYEYLGEKTVKNIRRPIRIYKIPIAFESEKEDEESIIDSIVDLSVPTDKPSIAVLPFVNMSGDKEQEYFSDGITEEIITALSKIPDMLVIARNPTFTYKGKAVNVKKVGKELGVRYVLEGSVRRSGNRIRLTAQLIDAVTGNHLWAERYDRDLEEIFAVQDELTLKIIAVLKIKISRIILGDHLSKDSTILEAQLKFYQGLHKLWLMNENDNIAARHLGEEIIRLDPNWPAGYLLLSWSYLDSLRYGWSSSPSKSAEEALKYVEKIFALDDSNSGAYWIKSQTYLLQNKFDEAIVEAEKVISIEPNHFAYVTLGYALNYIGKPKEAIKMYKKALRQNPKDPAIFFFLGISFCDSGQYKEAVKALLIALKTGPDSVYIRTRLAATYSLAGQVEDAYSQIKGVLDIDPGFILENYKVVLPYKNQADTDRILNALRKAGLK